jgi:hypothetical protein
MTGTLRAAIFRDWSRVALQHCRNWLSTFWCSTWLRGRLPLPTSTDVIRTWGHRDVLVHVFTGTLRTSLRCRSACQSPIPLPFPFLWETSFQAALGMLAMGYLGLMPVSSFLVSSTRSSSFPESSRCSESQQDSAVQGTPDE